VLATEYLAYAYLGTFSYIRSCRGFHL